VQKEKARKKLQIIQTAKAVGLTMAHRNKGPQRSFFGMGPTKSLIRPCVVEIVQFYQPNAQCMHSAYTFYP